MATPSKYRPEHCASVLDMGKQGFSRCEIAAGFDVHPKTVDYWVEHQPEFAEAYELAKVHSQAWWEGKGRIAIDNPKFNGFLWAKNMVARFRADWSEKVTLSGDPENPIRHAIEFVIVDPKAPDSGSPEAPAAAGA